MGDIQEVQDTEDFETILLASRKSIDVLIYDFCRPVYEDFFS